MTKGKIVIAEFDGAAGLFKAAEKLRDSGYKKFDCHSPFPIHGMDDAMGIKRSKLGFIAGAFAVIGFVGAVLLQWWASSVEYPLVISGKPFFSYQAYLPVTFAVAVLLAALAAVVGMLAMNKLPRWNHPLFKSELFEKFGDNGFFVTIESTDPKFDDQQTSDFLKSIGAGAIDSVDGVS
ncbi:MAG: DUF3341 domain-containing protein [candidate division Zixibacteria bacterium]